MGLAQKTQGNKQKRDKKCENDGKRAPLACWKGSRTRPTAPPTTTAGSSPPVTPSHPLQKGPDAIARGHQLHLGPNSSRNASQGASLPQGKSVAPLNLGPKRPSPPRFPPGQRLGGHLGRRRGRAQVAQPTERLPGRRARQRPRPGAVVGGLHTAPPQRSQQLLGPGPAGTAGQELEGGAVRLAQKHPFFSTVHGVFHDFSTLFFYLFWAGF